MRCEACHEEMEFSKSSARRFCAECGEFRQAAIQAARVRPTAWRKSCKGCGTHLLNCEYGRKTYCSECASLNELRHNRGLKQTDTVDRPYKILSPANDNFPDTKICKGCEQALSLANFGRAKGGKCGVESYCRACRPSFRDRTREYEARNAQVARSGKLLRYRAELRRRRLIKKWRQGHCVRARAISDYLESWYRASGKPWLKPGLSQAARYRIRYQNDVGFMLKQRSRSALRRKGIYGDALKRIRPALVGSSGAKALNSIERLLGYSMNDLKLHLESQFTQGMSWDAFKTGSIHIDHIRPLNTFDLLNPREAELAWSMNNLRPLWASDNCSRPKDGSDVPHLLAA